MNEIFTIEVRRGKRNSGQAMATLPELFQAGTGGILIFEDALACDIIRRRVRRQNKLINIIYVRDLPRMVKGRYSEYLLAVIANADFYSKQSWSDIKEFLYPAMAEGGKIIEIREEHATGP